MLLRRGSEIRQSPESREIAEGNVQNDEEQNHAPRVAPIEARIVPVLFRSRNFIWDNDHKLVEAHGVTWSQFLTLTSLRWANPEQTLSPTQLYAAAQVTSGGLTKMLHALEAQGLVERRDNPKDKRSRLVALTAEGARLEATIVTDLIATNQELIGGILTPDESEELARLLRKLSLGLEAKLA